MRDASPSAPPQNDEPVQPEARRPARPWRAPRFEVIALDCEISAYAPAGDEPLF